MSTKRIRTISFITALFYCSVSWWLAQLYFPVRLYADVLNADKPIVAVKDGTISINAKDVLVSDILRILKEKTGVGISIRDKSISARTITLQIENADLETVLKQLLKTNYAFVFEKDKATSGRFMLKNVSVLNKADEPPTGKKSFVIPYGEGKGEIRKLSGDEGYSGGPHSFAVAANGDIFVCDTFNNRIQVYSANGEHVRSINMPEGFMPDDIAIDRNGFAYVYAIGGFLRQYTANGQFVKEIRIDESRWSARGPMSVIGDSLYVRGNNDNDVMIARLHDGLIAVSPDEYVKPLEDVALGNSGRQYLTSLNREGRTAGVEIIDHDNRYKISIPLQQIVSIEFLGEDRQGNFMVTLESSTEDNKILMDVLVLDPSGELINKVSIPNDFMYWSIRQMVIGNHGEILVMEPSKDRLVISTLPFGK